jgi:hypothetical protein
MWRLYIPMELRARTMELPTRTMELRARTMELPTRTMELRARTMELRTRTMEFRTRTMELPTRTMELPTRTMELRARMSEICRDATRRSTVVELHRYPANTGTLPSHRHPANTGTPLAPASAFSGESLCDIKSGGILIFLVPRLLMGTPERRRSLPLSNQLSDICIAAISKMLLACSVRG